MNTRQKVIFGVILTSVLFAGAIFSWLGVGMGTVALPAYVLEAVETQDVLNNPNGLAQDTLTKLGRDFSQDDRAIYWLDYYRITGVDFASFRVLDDEYARDKDRVYYNGYEKGSGAKKLYIMNGADAMTFLSLHNGYARDQYRGYYQGEEIPGVQVETFEAVGGQYLGYAKDAYTVYEYGQAKKDLDAGSFRVLKELSPVKVYTADRNRVFLRAWFVDSDEMIETRVVDGANPKTFQILQGVYARDDQHAFYGAHAIFDADVKTFEVLESSEFDDEYLYAKDGKRAYYTYKPIEEADPNTFHTVKQITMVRGAFAEDSHNVYWDGVVFPRADFTSFENNKIPASARSLGSNYYHYRGKIYYYLDGQGRDISTLDPVNGAAAETFRVLSRGYAKDDDQVFCGAYAVEGLSPEGFNSDDESREACRM